MGDAVIEAHESFEETCYSFIIQTGANIPAKGKTSKWSDGSMILTINPGSENQSKPLKVTEHFPSETEGAITVDFWLPATIGVPKLLKVDLESNKLEIVKDALLVRQITIMFDRDAYRFPIKNYIFPHNPLLGNPSQAKYGCLPHLLVREGAGTVKHFETEEFILKAREEEIVMTKSMVVWNEPKEVEADYLFPGFMGAFDYSQLPRFLKFKEAQLQSFQECTKAVFFLYI